MALAAVALAACGQPVASATHLPARPSAAVRAAPPTQAPTGAAPVAAPLRLIVPKIGLDALVEPVGVDVAGNLAVPANPADVAWYRPGVAPGHTGDAVMDGHLDWTTGPAVFWHLGELQAGDELDVLSQTGARLRFVVNGVARYPYASHPPGLFAPDGPAELSLITCAGSWDRSRKTYLERLVVTARYVGLAA